MLSFIRVAVAYSVQEIREIQHELQRVTEVILWPSRDRYLWNPASAEADDGRDYLAPTEASVCRCCNGRGRWERWQIAADSGGTGGGGGEGLSEEQVQALIDASLPSWGDFLRRAD